MSEENNKRVNFNTRMGVVLAAAGSAVGLGNIWKFPYETGLNGGAAFLLIYFVCVILMGIPVMLSEFIIGRRAKSNVTGSFRKLSGNNHWAIMGFLGILASFLILSFYFVVAGWGLEYIYQAVLNNFVEKTPDELMIAFDAFTSDHVRPLMWGVIFIAITALIVELGVQQGIERYSKILMPFLLIILMLLGIRALTMPGSFAGFQFLFDPDFSKITPKVVMNAMGQAFFSLSIGAGCMVTYGSYIKKDNNLVKTAIQVAGIDTLVAILAGVAIFPAVFALGIDPGQGPQLVFVTLPGVFAQMPGGYIFAILFFILLSIAALTSTISMMETIVAYLTEEFNFSRKNVLITMCTALLITTSLCSLSLGADTRLTIAGTSVFGWCDYLTSKILLPVGGLAIAIFIGWFYNKEGVRDELSHGAKVSDTFFKTFMFLIRYFVPLAIVLIFLNELGLFEWLF